MVTYRFELIFGRLNYLTEHEWREKITQNCIVSVFDCLRFVIQDIGEQYSSALEKGAKIHRVVLFAMFSPVDSWRMLTVV